MSRNSRVTVNIHTRPSYVGDPRDYHFSEHLESLVGLSVETPLHVSHPDKDKILIPAIQAVQALFAANRMVSATYWLDFWRRQEPSGDNDHHNHLAIPSECCEVIHASAH